MKIALLSDVHLLHRKPDKRKDDILEDQWNKLEFVLDYCEKNSMPLLQAGDMFDRSRDWTTLDRFIKLVSKHKVQILSVFGQHDMYQRNTGIICNMTILSQLGYISMPDQHNTYENKINIHGYSFGETPGNHEGIMVIHAPITCASLYPGMEYNDAKSFLKKYNKYQLILCGDIHVPFIQSIRDRHIVNTGCMIRKTIKDYYNPTFYVYDTEKKTVLTVFIPCKPYEEVFKEDISVETKEILEDFIREITNYENTGTDILKNIHSFIEKNELSEDVKKIIYQIMTEGTIND